MNRSSEIKALYDAKMTKRVGLKLNIKTDKDILQKLDAEENMQGYIKSLIRRDLKMPPFIKAICKKGGEGYDIKELDLSSGKKICFMAKDEEDVIKLYEIESGGSVIVEKAGRVIDAIH